MRKELAEAAELIHTSVPEAYAFLYGSHDYPQLSGAAYLYPLWSGTLMVVEVCGLPFSKEVCAERIFGFHIHEGSTCTGTNEDPFADTGTHFNPSGCPHPEHAGDLPPLFGNRGYALTIFYTERFYPEEVIGRTLVIHDMPDDFKTQPAGNSGVKIGCGEIKNNIKQADIAT